MPLTCCIHCCIHATFGGMHHRVALPITAAAICGVLAVCNPLVVLHVWCGVVGCVAPPAGKASDLADACTSLLCWAAPGATMRHTLLLVGGRVGRAEQGGCWLADTASMPAFAPCWCVGVMLLAGQQKGKQGSGQQPASVPVSPCATLQRCAAGELADEPHPVATRPRGICVVQLCLLACMTSCSWWASS